MRQSLAKVWQRPGKGLAKAWQKFLREMENAASISSELFELWLENNEGQKHLEGGFYSNARLQSIARIERNESLASLVREYEAKSSCCTNICAFSVSCICYICDNCDSLLNIQQAVLNGFSLRLWPLRSSVGMRPPFS